MHDQSYPQAPQPGAYPQAPLAHGAPEPKRRTGLLLALIKACRDIEGSVGNLLEVATKVAGNTSNIPQLAATAPVLGLIVDEAIVQDGYMNALTDGFGGK